MNDTRPTSILHVDMDAFFAAVEQRDYPNLRGKPVLVGGSADGRGVVSTASYEARKFGCHSAQPMRQALRLCPDAIVIRPRGKHYSEIGRAAREIFARYTPLIEPLSIDEAFLDLTGTERLFGPPADVAAGIKRAVADELQLTCSVGVAPSKFVAKLASDLDKPDGLVVVMPDRVREFLDVLPIKRLWGAGTATQRKFADLGLHTFGDVRRLTRDALVQHFGIAGSRYYELVRGIDPRRVVPDRAAKSISHEQTFATDIADADVLRAVLLEQIEDVAARLRRHALVAQTVFVKLRTPDFATFSRRHTLPEHTDRTDLLWRSARELFDEWFAARPGPLRLLGGGAAELRPADQKQQLLFERAEDTRRRSLDRTVDQIRARFGQDALTRGVPRRGRRRD